MNAKSKKALVAVLTGVSLLSACGGSSDDGAGGQAAFQTIPTEVALNTNTANCPGPSPTASKVGDVLVIGGVAPYTVISPDHTNLTFGPAGSTTPTTQGSYTVSNRNQQFAVFASSCFERTVTVIDAVGRVATVTVTAASGSGS